MAKNLPNSSSTESYPSRLFCSCNRTKDQNFCFGLLNTEFELRCQLYNLAVRYQLLYCNVYQFIPPVPQIGTTREARGSVTAFASFHTTIAIDVDHVCFILFGSCSDRYRTHTASSLCLSFSLSNQTVRPLPQNCLHIYYSRNGFVKNNGFTMSHYYHSVHNWLFNGILFSFKSLRWKFRTGFWESHRICFGQRGKRVC